MTEIGLDPYEFSSKSGKPTGRKIGQCVSQNVIPDGLFLKALASLPEQYKLHWMSFGRMAAPKEPSVRKIRLTCPECEFHVWVKEPHEDEPRKEIICEHRDD
jgi:hypothetical protein